MVHAGNATFDMILCFCGIGDTRSARSTAPPRSPQGGPPPRTPTATVKDLEKSYRNASNASASCCGQSLQKALCVVKFPRKKKGADLGEAVPGEGPPPSRPPALPWGGSLRQQSVTSIMGTLRQCKFELDWYYARNPKAAQHEFFSQELE